MVGGGGGGGVWGDRCLQGGGGGGGGRVMRDSVLTGGCEGWDGVQFWKKPHIVPSALQFCFKFVYEPVSHLENTKELEHQVHMF